jgi:hypothetical protein
MPLSACSQRLHPWRRQPDSRQKQAFVTGSPSGHCRRSTDRRRPGVCGP